MSASTDTRSNGADTMPAVPYTPWFDVAAAKQRLARERGTRSSNETTIYRPGRLLNQAVKNVRKQPSNGESDYLTINFSIPTTKDPDTGATIDMMALAEVELTVEDWGRASVDNKPLIDLTAAVSQPDSLGGTASGAMPR